RKIIQIIIMTGEPTVETAVKAVKHGANDYLTKPINRDILLKAVSHAEQIKMLNDEKIALEEQNQLYQRELEATVLERTNALQNALQGIISLLSSVVEARDPYTAGHQRRVGNLSAAIADKMNLSSQIVETIRIIGYIHDIGKIVIPTEILSKPGALNSLEMQMIGNHPLSGYEMLMKVDLPGLIGEIIYQHHERCDGSGYPRGLSDNDINIEAKIIMVADVVEAMMSHRPYRPALGLEAALQEIRQNAGIRYDTDVVAKCMELFYKDHYTVDDSEHPISFPL
ncbi:MAG TPA: HD domain-containing phosphohydrolase, partial [Anaerovoracaceae bacterium]|nr:HD domain-containing phosphohydrolase [Anaerovoracaceae bacterium]